MNDVGATRPKICLGDWLLAVCLLFSTTTEPFDTDKMALEFVNQFPQQAFTVGQELVFSFMEKKVLSVIVRELEGMHWSASGFDDAIV